MADQRRLTLSRRGLLTALPAGLLPFGPAAPVARLCDARIASITINGKAFLPMSEAELHGVGRDLSPFAVGGRTLEVSRG